MDAALAYARAGWHVFPCEEPRAGDRKSGKAPLTPNGKDDATTDPDVIRGWWARTPNANIGIATKPSNLIVLDVDVGEGKHGRESLGAIDSELTDTRVQRTGSGGLHIVYERGDKEPRQALHIRDGLDILGNGYIIASPSRHWSGGTYTWLNEKPLAPVPPIIHALKRIAKAPTSAPAQKPGTHASLPENNARIVAAGLLADAWPDHGRHFAFLALAGALASDGWDVEAITEFTTMVARLMPGCDAKAIADRAPQARDSVVKVNAGEPVAGWGTLAKLIPEETMMRAIVRLGLDEPGFSWATKPAPVQPAPVQPAPVQPAPAPVQQAAAFEIPPTVGEIGNRDVPPVRNYPSGIPALDARLGGGLSTRALHGVVSRTGAGKTGFGLATLIRNARDGIPGLYPGSEMTSDETFCRLAGQILGVQWRDILFGRFPRARAQQAVADLPIHIIGQEEMKRGAAGLKIVDDAIARVADRYGVPPIVCVDYMQNMVAVGTGDVRVGVSDIANELRAISQRRDCVMIGVSSTGRGFYKPPEKDADNPLSYLGAAKESGDIEFACANLLFLDVAPEHDGSGICGARVVVAKGRYEGPSFVGARFHGPSGRWEDHAPAVAEMSGDVRVARANAAKSSDDEEKVLAAVRAHAMNDTWLTSRGWRNLSEEIKVPERRIGPTITRLVVKRELEYASHHPRTREKPKGGGDGYVVPKGTP